MKAQILPSAATALLLLTPPSASADDLPLDALSLPDGFEVEVYARVENARQMAMSEDGILFVGSRRAGKLHAVVDKDGDGKGETVYLLDEDLNLPSGLTYKDGDLYVGAVSTIYRYPDIANRLENPPKPEVVTDKLPTERHHGWKFIEFGPDGKLYVPVGAPCNICLSEDDRFASIFRMDIEKPDDIEIVAHGVRNTVGFDWHPETKELWFTDNGRDWMGDDLPPCELNRVTEVGQHFGYPFVHGDDIADPEFGDKATRKDFVKPALNLGPHTAPLGMVFYRGGKFPGEYHHRPLIAEHGSWNRSEEAGPIGYRITMAVGDADNLAYETFIDGWLQDEKPWGRPVDILEPGDGSIFISDDLAGAIYRVTYRAD